MATQNKVVEAQPDRKNGHKSEPVPVSELSELANVTALPLGPLCAAGDGSIQTQAARLSDARLHSVQRQAMAAQVGQIQGNRHLKRVIGSPQRGQFETTAMHHGSVGDDSGNQTKLTRVTRKRTRKSLATDVSSLN